MNSRIRKARSEDLQRILQLVGESYDLEVDKETERVISMWHASNTSFLVLEQVTSLVQKYGEVIGYVVYERLPRRILLLNILVGHKYRRSGYGTSLIKRVESVELIAHHTTYTRAHMLVSDQLIGVHLFLSKCGWKAIEVIKPPYFIGSQLIKEDGYLFERRCQIRTNLGANYGQAKAE